MTPHPEPVRLQSADEILRSKRTDLYLGIVAPTGIRRESFQACLTRALEPFRYAVEMVHLADLLKDFRRIEVDERSEDARLRTAMDAGTKLREEIGQDALARAALVEIHRLRDANPEQPRAFVLWSLKHPEEVATLRLVYGGAFHLVGLFASEEERIEELTNRPGVDVALAKTHIDRDREEGGRTSGQLSRDTFHRADVFLHWGAQPGRGDLERFVDTLFGRPTVTPTADEHRMFLAYASSLRSGELSRQVGAALVSSDGDILALGANDVPRRGGGLYWPGHDDDRDAVHGFDANVKARLKMQGEIALALSNQFRINEADLARAINENPNLREITEYGRAVHAEMEALLACARSGRSTRGSTLYVTTYPCHNCARHIIAAGVGRVVFVEPYPKSRALALHDKDVVEAAPGHHDEQGRVRFEPYLGIGPRRFFDYFSMRLGSGYELRRKEENGDLAAWDPAKAALRCQAQSLPIPELETELGAELVDFRVDQP